MDNKKIINLATEKYVNDTIDYKAFDVLQTEDKTIIGAINELFTMMNDISPEYTVKAQMFYGIINPAVSGPLKSYANITMDMLVKEPGIISTRPGERSSISLNVNEGCYIVIAVPALYNYRVTKDNGFGGKVAFDESFIGANGIDVKLDGISYRIYGEFSLVGGNRRISIEKEAVTECGCPDITKEDIDQIMDETFSEDEMNNNPDGVIGRYYGCNCPEITTEDIDDIIEEIVDETFNEDE